MADASTLQLSSPAETTGPLTAAALPRGCPPCPQGSRYGGGSPTRNGGYGGFEPMGGYGSSSAGAPPPRVTASQVLGSEEGLVDDITTPGGLRPAPDASDLRRFVEAASAMDGLRLAELLRAKMEGPGGAGGSSTGTSWQVALRALCALEAVLQRGSSQACGEVAVMFQSEPSAVQALATSPQPLVRDAAARCLRLLLGEDAVPQAAAGAGAASSAALGGGKKSAAAKAPVQDLLSLDDEPPAAATAAAAAAAAAAGGGGGIDLLADLAGPPVAAPAAAAAPGGDSLFSGLQLSSAPAAAAAPATSADDMFGGLSLSSPQGPAASAPTPAVAAAAMPPQPSRATAPLDDLFSDMALGGGIAAAVPAATAAFPTMQQQQQQQQQPAAAAAAQQQQPWQQQQHAAACAMQMQPLGGLAGAPGLAGIKVGPASGSGAALSGAAVPGGVAGIAARVMSSGGSLSGTLSPNAVAAAAQRQQQPWSGGITKDHPAFDFVMEEFGKH
jgi:hypothetical protein